MSEKKMIDSSAEYQDSPIYRVFTLPVFLKTLKSRKLRFQIPEKWDDPFENFFARYIHLDDEQYESVRKRTLENMEKMEGVKIKKDDLINNRIDRVFGQCWTLKEESDAMWRIYAPNGDGVKTKTTPNTMREVFIKHIKKSGDHLGYIQGKVLYYNKSVFSEDKRETLWRMHMDFTDVNHFFYIRPLYIKLDVFSHEEEYRFLIIVSRKQSKLKPDILKLEYIEIDFDPNELFDEIVLDPRMDEDMADLYKELIRSLGYNKEITRSEMYDVSSFMDDVLS